MEFIPLLHSVLSNETYFGQCDSKDWSRAEDKTEWTDGSTLIQFVAGFQPPHLRCYCPYRTEAIPEGRRT